MAAPKPLSPKQLKFVQLYLSGKTAADAYTQAGYKASARAARTNGPRLLTNPAVAAAVEAARDKAAKTADVTAVWVATRLKREATLKKNSGAARVKALELLGKTLGMFVDRTELTGRGGGPIAVDLRGMSDADLDALAAILSRAGAPPAGADAGSGAGREGPPPAG